MRTVTFPGLGWEFHLNRVAISVGDFPIYWYGIIIALGFLLAVIYCHQKAPKLGVKQDDFIDMLFFAVPLAIIGARLYYIVFYLDLFRREDGSLSLQKMLDIRDGGLAIYGAVIVAVLTVWVFCRVRKVDFLAFTDVGVFGLLIGQCIGRWGNFMNVEAYGGPTQLPWRMGIDAYVDGVWQYMEVHPTFFYESAWNLIGFLLLVLISRRFRKFDGQLMLTYFAWYGIGRGIIEGLRTDSLYLFQTGIRVSQLFGFVTGAVSIVLLLYHLVVKKHTPEGLYVNRIGKGSGGPDDLPPQDAVAVETDEPGSEALQQEAIERSDEDGNDADGLLR